MLELLSKTIKSNTFFSSEKGIELFRLRNKNGIEVVMTNYGIRLVSLFTPDKNGSLDDIVLGYDTLTEFETKDPFMNSIIGRVANRIGYGQFEIAGEKYEVDINSNQHCLHGGTNGLHMQVWEVKSFDDQQIHFYHFSKSGSEGFPGNLAIDVSVELTDTNELRIKYRVTTDQPTPVNLTYHPHFNLSGTSSQKIVNHLLQINATAITAMDSDLVATGELLSIHQTPLDFTTTKAVGKDIHAASPIIQQCGGYDHNFVLNKAASTLPFLAAKLSEPNNGRTLEVWTTQPGLQVYTCNGMTEIGKGNLRYGNHAAICLEPQYFPNSPNIPSFPSIILSPDQPYFEGCIYKFGLI